MSLPPETMMDLMAYTDGELDTSARTRVEELLRSNDEARRVVAAMGTLGDVVRTAEAERAPASARVADGIVDDVMAAIERAEVTQPGKKNVVAIGASRTARSSRAGVYSAVALVGIAAGFFLVLHSRSGPPVIVDERGMPSVRLPVAPIPTSPPSAVAVADTESQGVDLEEAESAQGKVDVFFTPSTAAAGAVASVVVWIDDRHGGH
jgi:anti-sigma factor RsiW